MDQWILHFHLTETQVTLYLVDAHNAALCQENLKRFCDQYQLTFKIVADKIVEMNLPHNLLQDINFLAYLNLQSVIPATIETTIPRETCMPAYAGMTRPEATSTANIISQTVVANVSNEIQSNLETDEYDLSQTRIHYFQNLENICQRTPFNIIHHKMGTHQIIRTDNLCEFQIVCFAKTTDNVIQKLHREFKDINNLQILSSSKKDNILFWKVITHNQADAETIVNQQAKEVYLRNTFSNGRVELEKKITLSVSADSGIAGLQIGKNKLNEWLAIFNFSAELDNQRLTKLVGMFKEKLQPPFAEVHKQGHSIYLLEKIALLPQAGNNGTTIDSVTKYVQELAANAVKQIKEGVERKRKKEEKKNQPKKTVKRTAKRSKPRPAQESFDPAEALLALNATAQVSQNPASFFERPQEEQQTANKSSVGFILN